MSKSQPFASQLPKLSAPFQVPLSALAIDADGNARNNASVSDQGIKQMAAMLFSMGQLNPIIVSKCDDGRFSVHAGGRRTRGFWLLRDQGKIAADHLVDVREIDGAHGVDVSLVENISQEPMHPVDEFLAYKKLADKGYTPEGIAKAYGEKVLHIKRRLKLADVHPDLLDQYRAGEIQLDQIMALASCDDQARQLEIWHSLAKWERTDQYIRRRIAEDEVSVDDPRVKLVGLDAYLSAGGQLRQDLFSEDGKGEVLTDVGLLDMLVADKVEAAAEALRAEGWAWVEVLQSYGYEERQQIRFYPTVYLPETDEQKVLRETLEAEIEAKEAEMHAVWDKEEEEDGDEAAVDALRGAIDALEKKLESLEESRIDLNGVDMLVAGAVVFADEDEIVIHKPMIRVADLPRQSKDGASGEVGEGGSGSEPGATERQAEGMSDRLITNLTAHRTAALQASLVAQQSVAIAALAAHMAASEFDKTHYGGPIKINVSSQQHMLRDASPTMEGCPAQKALIAERDALQQLLPLDSKDFLPFFIEQGLSISLRVIAYCTALSVNGVRGKNATRDEIASLVAAVDLDMRQWWAPTSDNYLMLVPKAKMIEAVVEARGQSAAEGWDKLKKQEVLDRSHASLEGSGWLPSVLR